MSNETFDRDFAQVVAAHNKAEMERDDAREVLSRLEEWTHEHGAALCPTAGSADTFGDGMRTAKQQVGRILWRKPL